MIPSMRFYIVSIVSIFIALGIGIYIGFVIDGNNIIDDKQQDLISIVEKRIDDISYDNDQLKIKNEELNKQLENNKAYMDLSYSYIIEDKLQAKRIMMLELSEDYPVDLSYEIEMAGGRVKSVLNLSNTLEADSNLKDFLQALIEGRENAIKDLMDGYSIVGDYSEAIDGVVLVGGFQDEVSNERTKKHLEIINTLKEFEIDLLYVEKERVNYSDIKKLKASEISSVDNVDNITGKISSIYILSGQAGNYGVKDEKENLMPELKKEIVGGVIE